MAEQDVCNHSDNFYALSFFLRSQGKANNISTNHNEKPDFQYKLYTS
jgi:hypothetical protein